MRVSIHPPKHRCCRSPRRAFSLVEVTISLGICSVAMVSILGLFVVGLQLSGESAGRVEAANLATSLLRERLVAPEDATLSARLPAISSSVPQETEWFVNDSGQSVTEAEARYSLRFTTSILAGGSSSAPELPVLVSVTLALAWPASAPADSPLVDQVEVTTAFSTTRQGGQP